MSTLLADTIRKTGGTAGVDIKVNNSSTYVDGTNKSQNVVAAITKGWINLSYAGSAARNMSSQSDNYQGSIFDLLASWVIPSPPPLSKQSPQDDMV